MGRLRASENPLTAARGKKHQGGILLPESLGTWGQSNGAELCKEPALSCFPWS